MLQKLAAIAGISGGYQQPAERIEYKGNYIQQSVSSPYNLQHPRCNDSPGIVGESPKGKMLDIIS